MSFGISRAIQYTLFPYLDLGHKLHVWASPLQCVAAVHSCPTDDLCKLSSVATNDQSTHTSDSTTSLPSIAGLYRSRILRYTVMAEEFDEKRLNRESWEPLYITGEGELLSKARLPATAELLVFRISGESHALLTSDMVLYHVAQGTVNGVPFLVSFCCVCHSGAQLDPRVNGNVLTFQCGGLYDGSAILRDFETGTYWHHITGQALHGNKVGAALTASPLQVSSVAAALQDNPRMRLHRSRKWTVLGPVLRVVSRTFQVTGLLPPAFTKTMPKEDPRLPRMTLGLGVRVGGEAKFYEMSRIKAGPISDNVGGDSVTIDIGKMDSVPFAVDSSGQRPMQFFLRWYGFALTFPDCAIWQPA
eukprot:jgi/Ulvmu1/12459/UM009_0111.1